MRNRRLRFVLPFAIVIVGLLVAAVMIRARPPAKTRPTHAMVPVVRAREVMPATLQLIVETHGTVMPRTEATLVSEVAGRIVRVAPSFSVGSFVEKGEALIEIDRRDYELAVVRARGVVAQGKVRAETEEAQARLAREEWERLGEGEASPLANRELQLEEARAALASAEAALEQAERDLGRCHIRAPFDGRVRSKSVDIGQYVSRGAMVAALYAVDCAEVRLPLPDSELAYLDLPLGYLSGSSRGRGPEVGLFADFAGERHRWQGRIVRVEGEIDPISRMVYVVAQVKDPYGRKAEVPGSPLSIGLFVDAKIVGREIQNAIVLPRSALRAGGRVLIIDTENRLHFRDVEIVREKRDEVIVSHGLTPGERICVSTLDAVTEGMTVRVLGDSVESKTVPEIVQ